VYELPEVAQAAVVRHYGPYRTMYRAYNAIGHWIESHEYESFSPWREIYLRDQSYVTAQDQFITEIQIPLRSQTSRPLSVKENDGIVFTHNLAGLRVDFVPDQAVTHAVQTVYPGYLPEGLAVTQPTGRVNYATDIHGQVALMWTINSGTMPHIIFPWPPNEPTPEVETIAGAGQMLYWIGSGALESASLLIKRSDYYIMLSSPVLEREEMVKVALSFSHE
jgi:hypothetical protein